MILMMAVAPRGVAGLIAAVAARLRPQEAGVGTQGRVT